MANLATETDILDSVRDTIRGLDLAKLPDDEIQVRLQPWDSSGPRHGITVHPLPERYNSGGTNERDDIGYGVGITIVLNNDDVIEDHDELDRWLFYRAKIRRNVNERNGVTGVGQTWHAKWEPGQLNPPREFRRNWTFFSSILRVTHRESRS